MLLFSLAMLAQIAQTPPQTGSSFAAPAGLEVIWAPTVAQAQESARSMKDGRILIFFTDPDCGECSRMLKIIAPSTSFFAFTRDKVPVPVPISTPEGLKLAQKMRVVGVPTWIVATPDLLECSRQEGVTTQQGWSRVRGGERSWADSQGAGRRVRNPANAAAVFEVARQLFQREPASRPGLPASAADHAKRRRFASRRARTSPRSTSTRAGWTTRRRSWTSSSGAPRARSLGNAPSAPRRRRDRAAAATSAFRPEFMKSTRLRLSPPRRRPSRRPAGQSAASPQPAAAPAER